MTHLDELREQVNRLPTIREGVKQAFAALAEKIAHMQNDPAQLAALASDIRNNLDGIVQDVMSNTPDNDGDGEPDVPEALKPKTVTPAPGPAPAPKPNP